MNKLLKSVVAAGTGLMLVAGVAAAAVTTGYSLFGGAEYVSPGNASTRAVKLVSDTTDPFSGVSYNVVPGTTFADVTTLSTDFMPESDDTCVGGSPRFSISVEDSVSGDTGNIFVYLGTDSGSPACVPGVWQNSTDLLEVSKLVDTSQLDAGTFYDPYATALTKYGDYVVTDINLVVDAGWASSGGEQTVLVDNTTVNEVTYSYEPTREESMNACKNGGWRTMTGSNGGTFKNQGDCVSYFATGGSNLPSGQ